MAKASTKQPGAGKVKGVKKNAVAKKLRLGVLVGKDFDPVKPGTQWPDFPARLSLTKDDWGKYSADAATAVRMQQLHPDLLDIDIITEREVTQKRLQKNHVNITFWPEIGVAMLTGDKRHIAEVTRCCKNPDCRLDPSWDYYDWVLRKPRYLEQCQGAGIPIIPSIFYKDGFDPKRCLEDVQSRGWKKFLVKIGYASFFGNGAINGSTEDFLGTRATELEDYAKENRGSKTFIVQPYTLKPDGQVFDEVRNIFIDGEWRFSVFTHGTDESDAGYYAEPDGPRKEACKALALKVYAQVLKAATWQGRRQTPLLVRVDVGVIPKRGGDSLHRRDNVYFLNEVEFIMTTWFDRYAPFSVQDVMAQATVKHALELLVGLLRSERHVPDRAEVSSLVAKLNNRLGPFKHLKV